MSELAQRQARDCVSRYTKLTALAKRSRVEFGYQERNHPDEILVKFPQTIVKLYVVWTCFVAGETSALALCHLDYIWNVTKCVEDLEADLLTLSSYLKMCMFQCIFTWYSTA